MNSGSGWEVQYQSGKGAVVNTATRARFGWRKRLPILAVLSLLAALPIGLAGQTPAHASVTLYYFAGNGTAGFSGDSGAATSAQLNQPQGLAIDMSGDVYIWDNLNKRIREVTPDGNIWTVDGDGTSCTSPSPANSLAQDNAGLCSSSYPVGFAQAAGPTGPMFDNGGWLDQSDWHIAGHIGSTYSPGDGGTYDESVAANSLASGDTGVYFAGASTAGWPGNSIKTVIGIGNPGGSVSTVAGMSGTSTCNYYPPVGSAPLTAAGACIHPQYLTLWSHYLYFFDSSPGWQGPTIWRIDLNDSTEKLYRVAGSGSFSDYGANGSTATSDGISHVGPIAIDSNGNLFFGSTVNGTIREVDTSGKLWNVYDIGQYQNSYVFDAANNLYVSTPGINRVLKLTGLDPVTSKGNLVALGDSVPAGEGINYGFTWNGSGWVRTGPSSPTWVNTSSSLGSNYQECHQSGYSFVNYFAGPYTVYNMACSGATALMEPTAPGSSYSTTFGGVMVQESFTDAQYMPAELGSSATPTCSGCDAATPPTRFDTNLGSSGTLLLTLGADDVDFGDWMTRCYTTTNCGTGDQSTLNTMLSQEETDLRTTITEINSRAGADGYGSSHKLHLVVTDYYNPYGSTFNSSCIDTGNGVSWPGITSGQQTFIVGGLHSLDGNIKAEVDYANANDSNLNATLVDLSGDYGGTNVMAGHTFCSGDPWVYGPSIDYPHFGNPVLPSYPAPLHPTPEGQQAIYSAVMQQGGL